MMKTRAMVRHWDKAMKALDNAESQRTRMRRRYWARRVIKEWRKYTVEANKQEEADNGKQ